VIGSEHRAISLVDVEAGVRMRALALGARDFVAEVRSRGAPTPIAPTVAAPITAVDRAELLAPPRRGVTAPTTEPNAPPVAFAIEVSGRATWLGLRLVAPSLSLEGQARLSGTPLVLWVALDGLYASGNDALGEVRALDVGGRAGARVVLDVDPFFALSLSVGAMAAYVRAEGVPPGGGVRRSVGAGIHGGVIDGPLFGIDVAVAASLQLSRETALTLSIGALGYLLGLEARAEDRPVVSFRDVAPWAALGLRFTLR
jgi:hypothetical protein